VSHLPAENAKLMDPQQHDMISSRRSQTKHEPQVNSSCFATAAAKEAESAFEDRIRFGNASIDFAARAKHRERERERERARDRERERERESVSVSCAPQLLYPEQPEPFCPLAFASHWRPQTTCRSFFVSHLIRRMRKKDFPWSSSSLPSILVVDVNDVTWCHNLEKTKSSILLNFLKFKNNDVTWHHSRRGVKAWHVAQ
jgi:hypothetical protein